MNYYVMLAGRKWYYRLVPKDIDSGKLQKGLLTDHPKANLKNELVISMTCPDSYVHPGKIKLIVKRKKIFGCTVFYFVYSIC